MGTDRRNGPGARALAAGLLVVLAALLGACGDEGADRAGGRSGDGTILDASGAAGLSSAVEASVAQPSLRVRMEITGPFGETIESTMAQSADGLMAEGTMALGPLGEVPVLVVGGTFYFRFPDLPGDRPWVRLTPAELKEVSGLDVERAASQDPFAQLSVLESVSDDVAVVGTEESGGEDLTRYRLRVRVPDLLRRQVDEGVLTAEAAEAAEETFAPTTTIDVWVGPDRLVRRMEYAMEVVRAAGGMPEDAVGSSVDYRFGFEGYGEVLDVVAPPEGQVMGFGELAGSAARPG